MSRYTCYKCKAEHGTDNVVAYCAFCVNSLEEKIRDQDKLIEAMEEVVGALKQLFHNGDHFVCEAERIGGDSCRKKGGDSMGKCQTCCNKWQAIDALRSAYELKKEIGG